MGYYGRSSSYSISSRTIVSIIFLVICAIVGFKSCTSEQSVTKNLGGTMKLN